MKKLNPFIVVFTLSAGIALALAFATYHINFWPTDSYSPYNHTAAQLFELTHLSEMHDLSEITLNQLNMRGKEALILGIAIMQRLLGDTASLYPNVLLLILALLVSSLLIYCILKKLFDPMSGLLGSLLFITCFWPILYVLQGAHQPLVLMNFLFSIAILQLAYEQTSTFKKAAYLITAGFFAGLMMFSSPTALIYAPYFLIVFAFMKKNHHPIQRARLIYHFCIFIAGALLVSIPFMLPNPLSNFRQFIIFLLTSQHGNHFGHYREYLHQFFHVPETFRGAGWTWVTKYFVLIMPILLSAYLISILYLLKKSFHRLSLLIIIFITLSTPLAVEMAQVSQFGRNYFSWLPGMIFAISCAFYHLQSSPFWFRGRKILVPLIVTVVSAHVIFNVQLFFRQVFPQRMGTTTIYHWLKLNNINTVLAIQDHPNNMFTVDVFNNPKFEDKVKIQGITSIAQPRSGIILVPPSTGKTIWNDCSKDDFTKDVYLTKLYESGEIEKYAVASFKTMAASKIWRQEEEVCTYRDLILKQIDLKGDPKGLVYLLDAQKIQKDWVPRFSSNGSMP